MFIALAYRLQLSVKQEILFKSSKSGMCAVCHDLFALPLRVFNKLCSVIVVLPGHLLY